MNGFVGAIALVTIGAAAIAASGRSATHTGDGAPGRSFALASAQLDTTLTQSTDAKEDELQEAERRGAEEEAHAEQYEVTQQAAPRRPSATSTGTTTRPASTSTSSPASRSSARLDKFESGTGWPSFTSRSSRRTSRPKTDRTFGMDAHRGALRSTRIRISATCSTTVRRRPACATA